ncbi:hypothetical protein VNI00_013070 [Paramarasmius palmivorus]|uniref:F-box domain-containing protein n=1 Tax=Paramarasmius palmivorus TaxID=297713 RepID=A0AAW0BZC2_9AGAR
MASLDTLPTELLFEIIAHFPKSSPERFETFKNLRLVSKRFRAITTPFMFAVTSVKIDERSTALEHSSALKSLSDISYTVQKLSVQVLDYSIIWKTFGGMNRLSRKFSRYSYYKDGEEKQNVWSKNLPSVIRGFKLLNSLAISSVSNSVLLSGLWQTLRDEKIHLKELTVQWRIEPALLDYLASYSGVERLSVTRAFPQAGH